MNNRNVENMSPAEFVRQKTAEDRWQLLDVREPWEIEIVAINGSVQIPMPDIAERLHELKVDQPVAVLCHSGVRSFRVANFLRSAGFEQVANIDGGIDAWAVDVDSAMARY